MRGQQFFSHDSESYSENEKRSLRPGPLRLCRSRYFWFEIFLAKLNHFFRACSDILAVEKKSDELLRHDGISYLTLTGLPSLLWLVFQILTWLVIYGTAPPGVGAWHLNSCLFITILITQVTANAVFCGSVVFIRVLFLLQADLEQYKKALTDAGCNLSPLQYIKQWK